MAKLTKVAQRIFGSAAGVDQIGVFGSYFAADPTFTSDPAEVMSLSNWLTGWYAAVIGGNAPTIQDMNGAMFAMTYQLGYLMQEGIPEWDADTIYYTGSFVNNAGVLYISATDSNQGNVVSNNTYWKPYGSTPVGTMTAYCGLTAPAGWVLASGDTIGSAASGSVARANADTLALYTLVWNSSNNADIPIQNSSGVTTTRGASAAADFAANKRLPLPDLRGTVPAGVGNMGGTDPGRLTTATIPFPNSIGSGGGFQSITLNTSQIPSHTHTQNSHTHGITDSGHSHGTTDPGHRHGVGNTANVTAGVNGYNNSQPGTNSTEFAVTGITVNSATTGVTANSATAVNNNTGGGGSHVNVQPTTIMAYIIKL